MDDQVDEPSETDAGGVAAPDAPVQTAEPKPAPPAPDTPAVSAEQPEIDPGRAMGISRRGANIPRGNDQRPAPYSTASLALATPRGDAEASRAFTAGQTDAIAEQRRAQTEEKAANNQARKSDNANILRTMEGSGQRHYTDPFGKVQPIIEAGTGKPLFTPSAKREKGINPKTGEAAWVTRNRYGENEYGRPQLVANVNDPTDTKGYYDFGENGGMEPAGDLGDLAKHQDFKVAKQAMALQRQQKAALWKQAITPMEQVASDAKETYDLTQQRHLELQSHADELQQQLAQVSANPQLNETQGGIFGFGGKPTDAAIAAQSQKSALESRLQQVMQEQSELAEQLKPGGKMARQKRQAQLDLTLFKAKAKHAEYSDLVNERMAALKAEGGNPATDPTLKSIQTAQQMYGNAVTQFSGIAQKDAKQQQAQADAEANPTAMPVPEEMQGEPFALAQRGIKNVGGVSVDQIAQRYGDGLTQGSKPGDLVKISNRVNEITNMLANSDTHLDGKVRQSLVQEQQYLTQLGAQRMARLSPEDQRRVTDTLRANAKAKVMEAATLPWNSLAGSLKNPTEPLVHLPRVPERDNPTLNWQDQAAAFKNGTPMPDAVKTPPTVGQRARDIAAGAVNATEKAVESFTSPAGIATLASFGGVGLAAKAGIPFAKALLTAGGAAFAAWTAKDTIKLVQHAREVTADPTKSTQEASEAWTDAGITGAMTAAMVGGELHMAAKTAIPKINKAFPEAFWKKAGVDAEQFAKNYPDAVRRVATNTGTPEDIALVQKVNAAAKDAGVKVGDLARGRVVAENVTWEPRAVQKIIPDSLKPEKPGGTSGGLTFKDAKTGDVVKPEAKEPGDVGTTDTAKPGEQRQIGAGLEQRPDGTIVKSEEAPKPAPETETTHSGAEKRDALIASGKTPAEVARMSDTEVHTALDEHTNAAAEAAHGVGQVAKEAPPTWRVTIQKPQGDVPGYMQVDQIDQKGNNAGSTTPDKLLAQGYKLPDLTKLDQGQYTLGDLQKQEMTPAKAGPSDEPTVETKTNPGAIPQDQLGEFTPANEGGWRAHKNGLLYHEGEGIWLNPKDDTFSVDQGKTWHPKEKWDEVMNERRGETPSSQTSEPSTSREPAIKRGTNSPLGFVQTALDASKASGAEKSNIRPVLMDFTRRLHTAAPAAFKDMEVHVLEDKDWQSHPQLGKRTPDSAAAYDQHTNTLYLNSDKLTGENLASAIVHEAGHFAEKFYLGEDFTQGEWEKLTPDQRVAAYQQYTGNALVSGGSGDLTNNKKARSEWVAQQFARVVRGETKGMSERMIAKLKDLLEAIRSVVKKWIGDAKLTTEALDRKIVEMMGYDDKEPPAEKPAPIEKPNPPKEPITPKAEEKPAAPVAKPPVRPEKGYSVSPRMQQLGDDLFGTPAESDKETYGKKFDPALREKVNDFVTMVVRDMPTVRSRAALADFLDERFPKARPYSESLFRILSGFAEMDETGNFADVYKERDAAKAPKTEPPAVPPKEETATSPAKSEFKPAPTPERQALRDLIESPDSHQRKAIQMRQMADKLGIPLKDMQEKVEAELVQMMQEFADVPNRDCHTVFKMAVDLYGKQPMFTARTSTSVENQAYSTPAPLAVALGHMTYFSPKPSLYEPTAGNGMLMVGSDLAKSAANEINDQRAEALRQLGVGTVTQHDAITYTPKEKYDTIHANPPFGSIDNVNYNGYGIRRLEHLISLKALEAMKDGGTASIILGANLQPGETARGAQWVFENYLYGNYNVADNFEVAGDLYGNQGTKWPVRVITIAGRKDVPKMGDFAPKSVDRLEKWDDVWARSEKVKNEIESKRNSLGAGGQTGVTDRPRAGGVTAEKPGVVSPQAGGGAVTAGQGGQSVGSGVGESKPPSKSTGGRTDVAPAGDAGRPEVSPKTVAQPGVGGKPPARVQAGSEGSGGSGTNAPGSSVQSGGGTKLGKVSGPDSLAEKHIPYVPRSEGTPFGTITPTNIGMGTHRALDELKARVGPIDKFVSDKIDLPVDTLRGVMAADQIDGLALGIDQIEKGSAVIIGDQTGIGKGRQAAGLIRYALVNGKIPVFFTKDPKLFTDMFGDLKDIQTKAKPFIFGESGKASIVNSDGDVLIKAPSSERQKSLMDQVDKDGLEKAGFDSIFSTYSQVNTRNRRQLFFENLAKNNDVILILDEAHEAAGDGESSMQAAFMQGGTVERGKGSQREKISVPGLLKAAGTQKGRGGATYLSATYAKRPDNMPLYSRTDLSKAAQNFGDVVSAMKAGGVALQQALSEALAARGQYVRRERDFSGVKYSLKTVGEENKANIIRQVDNVTDILGQVVDFSKRIRDAVLAEGAEGSKSTAMTENQMDMTDFAAIVHNQVSQLLLAAKAEDVVNEAVAAMKRGEKPVVTMMNTMESFLDHYVDDHGIKQGQAMTLGWPELLRHALERTLRTTTKLPNGDTEIGHVNPEDVGLGDAYKDILDAIKETDVKFPVSPIDYIIQKLAAAGVKVGELTGRQSGIKYTDFDKNAGTYQNFRKANKNALVNGFNSGAYDGLLFNASGSTGLSIHASPKFKDSKKRHMIIAQPALDINTFVQTLGRIMRTGMKPGGAEYTHLALPLQAEMRPAAVTNKKMKSLNANTTAESEGGLSVQSVDMLNKYGDHIVAEYLDGDPDLQAKLGLDIDTNEDGVPVAKPDLARKFMGRLSLLPDATQKEIYSAIIPTYNEHIDQLRATGDYDLDIVVHDDWDGVKDQDMQLKAGSDDSNILTSSVRAQKWEVTDNRKVPTGEQMRNEFQKNTGGVEKFNRDWTDFRMKTRDRLNRRLNEAESDLERQQAKVTETDNNITAIAAAQTKVTNTRADMARWADTEQTFNRIFSLNNEAVNLIDEQSHESYDGMLVGVKFPKISEDSPLRVAPSRFQFRYLVNQPGGRMFISGAQLVRRNYIQTPSRMRVDDFKGERGDSRYKRWVVTGNPVAAYKATGGQGKMIRFKSREGDVVTGLLMRNNWNVSKLAADPRFSFASGDAAARFLMAQGRWGSGVAIVSDAGTGGQARIARDRNGNLILTVPSSTQGRNFFLDPQLRDALGDFYKVGNRMTAEVPETELSGVAKRIGAISGEQMRAEGTGDKIMQMVQKANESQPLGTPDEKTAPDRGSAMVEKLRANIAAAKKSGQPAAIMEKMLAKLEGDDGEGLLGTPSSAMDTLNKAKEAVGDFAKDVGKLPSYTGFNKALNEWVGNRQLGIMATERAVSKVLKEVPEKKTRDAISNYIDAGGDMATLQQWEASAKTPKLKAGYKTAQNLTPEQLATVTKIKGWFENQFDRAVAGGVMKDDSFRDDYVTHIVDKPFVGGGVTSPYGGKIAAKFKYSKQRTFPNFHELEEAGFRARTKDIGEIMAAYGTHLTNAIETRRLARALLTEKNDRGEPLGKPILGQYTADAGSKANYINDPASSTSEHGINYKAVSHPAFRAWRWSGTSPESGKPIIQQGEIGVHPDIHGQLENAIGRSAIRQWYDSPGSPSANLAKMAVKGLDLSQAMLKGTMLGGISTFHAVHEYKRALGNRVVINPIITQPIDPRDTRTQMMVRSGLMLSGDRDAENLFSEGLGSRSLVDKIPAIGKVSRAVADYTFHQLIPALKWHAWNAVYERNLKTFGAAASPDDVAYLTSRQVNARFGHLNLADLNRDPTAQHIAQWLALAPDFLESNVRNYGQDAKGATGAKTGREPLKALVATALTLWILARVINRMSDDDPHFEEPFGVIHNGRRYTMRNEAEDLWRLFTEPGKFVSGRLSPAVQTVDQLRTGQNWRGEKVSTSDTLKEYLTKYIPISGRWIPGMKQVVEHTATGAARTVSPFEEFLSSQGIQVARHSPTGDAYDLARKYKTAQGIKEDAGTYPVSKYQQLRYALEDSNMPKARAEAEKLIEAEKGKVPFFNRSVAVHKLQTAFENTLNQPWTKTKDMDKAFMSSLTPKDREKVLKADRDRQQIANRFAAMFGMAPKQIHANN